MDLLPSPEALQQLHRQEQQQVQVLLLVLVLLLLLLSLRRVELLELVLLERWMRC